MPSATRGLLLGAFLASGFPGVIGAQAPPPPSQVPGQPRDPGARPPAEPVGTGIIRGHVVTADTGTPVQRARVSLQPAPPPASSPGTAPPSSAPGGNTTTRTVMVNGVPTSVTTGVQLNTVRPKTATTDAQGGFEFTELPAGSYRIVASPGQYSMQYLSISFGGKKPNGPGASDPGQPIQLGDGEAFNKATIALPRGSVIAGRVTDEAGVPLVRVQVYPILYPPGSSRGLRTGADSMTDDLGQYRLFGLAPGQYAVVVEARNNSFTPPNAPPQTEEEKIGFMTTFYPGAVDEASAQHVAVRAGGETGGIEIRVVSGRLFTVSGAVTDSQGRASGRMSGTLAKRSSQGGFSSSGFATDEQGRFQIRNVAPGAYRIMVRQQPTGPRNPDGTPSDPGESASVPLMLNADVDNLIIATSPGVTITGQVVYKNGPPPPAPNQMSFPTVRVNAQLGDPLDSMGMVPTPQPVTAAEDLTFTMKGLSGEYLLRANAATQFMKSVTLNGEDITDTPHEFKTGDRVTITLSSRASTLEGNITDASNAPVTDAALMLFSEDKASWRSNSLKTRRGAVDQAGHYRIVGLLPGRYFIIAVPRDRLNFATQDAAFFEQLTKDATSLVIDEVEHRQLDLKLVPAPGLGELAGGGFWLKPEATKLADATGSADAIKPADARDRRKLGVSFP